jgi:tetratricopeptide (TPR) repeat protein
MSSQIMTSIISSPDIPRQAKAFVGTKGSLVFVLLSLIIFISYSNTFKAAWHLDDYANVAQNSRLHLEDLAPENLREVCFASPEDKALPYRSLPFLTFAFNWYIHQDRLIGFHLINIFVHILTAFILFVTILNLFNSPNLADKWAGSRFFVALLTAVLWALNPIQIQAVTYIVQRMASMAAMFYILAIYLYVKARLSRWRPFYILCVLSYGCAIFSKENAAMLPGALLLLEVTFFQNMKRPVTRRIAIWGGIGAILLVIGLGDLLFGNPFSFLNGYAHRTFTPSERLLTAPRLLVFYLSLLFYPVPTRLSITHDIAVSTSILQPWTTLPSLLLIVLLISLAIFRIQKNPILSFAILFFVLNHAIESTVIGLELVFEHRNYLPSLFLFLPVALGIKRLIDHYKRTQPPMATVCVGAVILLLTGFGTATYIRNMAWISEKTLWEDAMSKAPEASRPAHELAYNYYEKTGQYNEALRLYHHAVGLSGSNIYEPTLSYNNIASIHYTRGDYERAIQFWQKALAVYPKYEKAYYRMALALTNLGRWKEAEDTLDKAMAKGINNPAYNQLKGIILLGLNKPAESISYFKKVLTLTPGAWRPLLNVAMAHEMLENHQKAEWFLIQARAINPDEPLILLCLAQNRLKENDNRAAGGYIDQFLSVVHIERVAAYLKALARTHPQMMISYESLTPLISEKLESRLHDIRKQQNRFQIPRWVSETKAVQGSDEN